MHPTQRFKPGLFYFIESDIYNIPSGIYLLLDSEIECGLVFECGPKIQFIIGMFNTLNDYTALKITPCKGLDAAYTEPEYFLKRYHELCELKKGKLPMPGTPMTFCTTGEEIHNRFNFSY